MKAWIKKMTRLLSGNSSNKDFHGSSSNTMSERLSCLPRTRKSSPRNVKSNDNETNYPSHITADDWMQRNKYALDQTLDFIDQYPELIKSSACEKLVDFVAKLGHTTDGLSHNQRTNVLTENYGRRNSTEDVHIEATKLVPEILVSHAQEDDSLCSNRLPTVFVCGNLDDNNWHRLLVDLSRVYNVHCFSTAKSSFNQSLQLSDIMLFLMDEISVSDQRYTEQLRVAITKGIDIVYVRDMSFELLEPDVQSKRSGAKIAAQSMRSLTSLPGFKYFKSRSRRTSADNISIDSFDSTKQEFSTSKSVTNTDKMDTLSASVYDRRPSSPKQFFDIASILRMEYGTAHGYHQVYHDQCIERIIITIESRHHVLSRARSSTFGSNSCNGSPITRQSMYSSVSNDSAIDDMYQCLTPEPNSSIITKADIEHGRDVNSHKHTETVFLVAADSNRDKPVIFHWPGDADDLRSINSSSSIDSFGFQDVDLSKRINQLDLLESNQSDN